MPNAKNNKGEMRLSFSRMDAFDVCQRAFYYKHIERRPDRETRDLAVGQAYHHAIAKMLETKGDVLANLSEYVDAGIEAEKKRLLKFMSQKGVDRVWSEVYENLDRLWKDVAHHLNPVLVEQRYFNSTHNFAGVVDVWSHNTLIANSAGEVTDVLDEPSVLDWKTKASLKRRRTQRDAEMSAQLAGYCLECGVRHASFVEIPRNTEAPIRVRTASYTDRDLEQWRQYLDSKMETIRSLGDKKEHYGMTPRSNPLCSPLYCPFFSLCYPRMKGGASSR